MPLPMLRARLRAFLLFIMAGCSGAPRDARPATHTNASLRLFNAASIARPLRMAADSFTARTGITVVQESQASLELARRITEFGDIPDVIAVADWQLFPTLLAPRFMDHWWLFARNRLVIAYTDHSRHRDRMTAASWRDVMTRSDVEVGRADPNTDPSGYRTLLAFQLAERFYRDRGLAARLLASAPVRNVRPREADQVALLQAGTLDYIWTYENLAHGAGLSFLSLPPEIDLGTAADSEFYRTASVRVAGRTRGDTVTFRGEPILYGVAIPRSAPDSAAAQRFVAFLIGSDGRRILRAAALDALDSAVVGGTARTP